MVGKRKRKVDTSLDDESEMTSGRRPFTKGWNEELRSVELLPTKGINGKIIRQKVLRSNEDTTVMSDNESEGNGESGDSSLEMSDDEAGGQNMQHYDIESIDTLPDLPVPGKAPTGLDLDKASIKIASLCLAITASPDKALSSKEVLTDEGDPYPKLTDLMSLLHSENVKLKEMVMLSVALVFKDICPGYRIRPPDKNDSNVQLKKETKQLRDFERALLLAYQQFLKFLDRAVDSGLGKASSQSISWSSVSRFGLSALRCQCELLRTMSHFNFRNILIHSIIKRAAQPIKEIAEVCCSTIRNEFKSEKSGAAEMNYEIVKMFSTVTMSNKHTPLEMFIDCLQSLSLRVHADEIKMLHRKAKQARRKRRKASAIGEDVDAEMLESHATTDTHTVKRFQADTLQEVALIYFR